MVRNNRSVRSVNFESINIFILSCKKSIRENVFLNLLLTLIHLFSKNTFLSIIHCMCL